MPLAACKRQETLFHVEDKDDLMDSVLELLRPGGVFVCAEWFCSEAIAKARSPPHGS